MPDIFISYNREDRDMARLFAGALEAEGLSVWWDAALRAGETYDEVTEQNLRTAGAVVVLWSKRSANSKWVRAEATVGERSSTLVPALIEDCERPIRFELVQTADLRHWRGDRADPHWRAFMQDIRAAISKKNARSSPAAQAAPPHDASIETAFWNSIKDSRDRAELEAYLKRYPNGNFAALAQNRLAALTTRSAAPIAAPAQPQPQRRAPPPAAEAKKSGNGLLVGGIAAGLVVIGIVAFLMTSKPEDLTADASAPVATPASATEAAQVVENDADEVVGPASVSDQAPPETPAGEALAELSAPSVPETPVIETPIEEKKSDEPFRDCDFCPLMAPIAGGAFQMGSPKDEPGRNAYEGPQREVTIKPFAIGVYELTTAEWKACADDGACTAKRADETGKMPALGLSWKDAQAYAAWLTKKTGRKYRLPSEAEWEYAARGGSASAYWWGEKFDRSRVSVQQASAVGSYEANAFGLFDVLGNAREWVEDCYVNNYVNAPIDGSAVADGDCGKRVVRGGAWSSSPVDMRTANRSRIDSGVSASYMGMRIAAELPG